MNIVVVSSFRNAESYIERYCDQMDEFQTLLLEKGHNLSLILGEGDSTDKTREALYEEIQNRFQALVVDVTHGGQHYGSVVHPERFKQLAHVGNTLWKHIPLEANYVALIESDLIWTGATLMNLLKGLETLVASRSFGTRRILIAPLVLHQDGSFYDTWAFRKEKTHLLSEPPYHAKLNYDGRFTEMDSVGSCVLMTSNIARLVRFPEKDVVYGFCREAVIQHHAMVYMDRKSTVYHP